MKSQITVPEQSLPQRALAYIMTRSAIEVAVGTLIIAALLAQFADGRWATIGWSLLGMGVALSIVEIPLLDRWTVRYTRFSADAERVVVRRGRWLRKVTTIASRQIFSVEVMEGPLLRRWGLVKVRFHCIAETEKLGPVDPVVARDLVEIIARLRDAE